ncbi:hypothetical protein ACROYT_G035876, partial [Oculina patagonica]
KCPDFGVNLEEDVCENTIPYSPEWISVHRFVHGLIAQPFYAARALVHSTNSMLSDADRPKLTIAIYTIGECSAIYCLDITILLITLISVERWLHMSSRRSLVTSRRGCFAVIILLLLPTPVIVFRVLSINQQTNKDHTRVASMASVLTCYLITSFAYFKVYRIIRHHQQQVQANKTSQQFGQSAIDLAKYKKSVASMLYILFLFSICFLPYIVASGVYLSLSQESSGDAHAVLQASIALLFLSSSLNPGLYLWRMNDIRNGVRQLLCRG